MKIFVLMLAFVGVVSATYYYPGTAAVRVRFVLLARKLPVQPQGPLLTYNNLGCWKDTSNRAIPPREGDPILDGSSYTARVNAIAKCARVAYNHGDDVFAVQNGGWCASSATARDTYRKYGGSSACGADGEGGSWANQVYEIDSISEVSLINLGCWADTSDRAIPILEGLDPVLDGSYGSRQDAIAKCVQAAHARGYNVMALQNGGQCAGARDAELNFKKYGSSSNCRSDSEGGSWANQVYYVRVLKTTTY